MVITLIDAKKKKNQICSEGVDFLTKNYPNGFSVESFLEKKQIMSDKHTLWFVKKFLKNKEENESKWSRVILDNLDIFSVDFIIEISKIDGFQNDYIYIAFQKKNSHHKMSIDEWLHFFRNSRTLNTQNRFIDFLYKLNKTSYLRAISEIVKIGKRECELVTSLEIQTNAGLECFLKLENYELTQFCHYLNIYENAILPKIDKYIDAVENKAKDIISTLSIDEIVDFMKMFKIFRRELTFEIIFDKMPSTKQMNDIERELMMYDVHAFEEFSKYFINVVKIKERL